MIQKESATDRISLSAVSDRGSILHGKGKAWLFQDELDWILTDCDLTHRARPLASYSREGSITLPSLSTTLERLNVARILTAVSQIAEKAMWEPGHNLESFHLVSSITSDSDNSFPPSTKSESHERRIADIWIKFSVLHESFWFESKWIRIVICIMKHRPISIMIIKPAIYSYSANVVHTMHWRSPSTLWECDILRKHRFRC